MIDSHIQIYRQRAAVREKKRKEERGARSIMLMSTTFRVFRKQLRMKQWYN